MPILNFEDIVTGTRFAIFSKRDGKRVKETGVILNESVLNIPSSELKPDTFEFFNYKSKGVRVQFDTKNPDIIEVQPNSGKDYSNTLLTKIYNFHKRDVHFVTAPFSFFSGTNKAFLFIGGKMKTMWTEETTEKEVYPKQQQEEEEAINSLTNMHMSQGEVASTSEEQPVDYKRTYVNQGDNPIPSTLNPKFKGINAISKPTETNPMRNGGVQSLGGYRRRKSKKSFRKKNRKSSRRRS